jgi:hypothetical protein
MKRIATLLLIAIVCAGIEIRDGAFDQVVVID